jgi:predicted pyridoxine 5'-phosphate oxidase superfamily flavin-nucleotide-binding protein
MAMDDSGDTFHRGERFAQERAGLGDGVRHAIRDYMPDQHRAFFAQLPFVVVGSVDDSGQPWASALARPPGFMASPSPHLLEVRALPVAGDPLVVEVRRRLGLLGIEPHTRRRNRLNGVVEAVTADGFSVRVQQSFGNCPKYIQSRKASFLPRYVGSVVRSAVLDSVAERMLRSADTFFIATAYLKGDSLSHGVDVSHRGGNPGFASVEDGVLRVPDYVGNNYFNTLGNLSVYPRAGLLVVDFATGDLLFVAVRVEIVWDGEEVERLRGAKRVLVMRVEGMVRVEGALGLAWGPMAASPFLEML